MVTCACVFAGGPSAPEPVSVVCCPCCLCFLQDGGQRVQTQTEGLCAELRDSHRHDGEPEAENDRRAGQSKGFVHWKIPFILVVQ